MLLCEKPRIELILGDCMDLLHNTPSKHYDLAIVDPPYGIGINTAKASVIPNKSKNPIFNKKDWDNSYPTIEYFNELIRVSINQIIWGGNHFLDYLGYCKAPIIWDKLNGDSMYADGEFAWTSKGLPKNLRIWKHQWCGAFKASERGIINIHPTQKPVALYRWLLKNYAKNGDKILDTHAGSFSSGIACWEMGFDITAIELDVDYFNAAIDRFKNYIKQQRLF